MSTKHTATLPDGTEVKRTSANRVYPFMVALGPQPKAAEVEQLKAQIDQNVAYRDRYVAAIEYVTNGGELIHTQTTYGSDRMTATGLKDPWDSRKASWIISGPATPEALVELWAGYRDTAAKNIYALQQAIGDTLSGPDFIGGWVSAGWCGSRELAERAERTQRNRTPQRSTRIIETVIH
jgi:hypothetical protein